MLKASPDLKRLYGISGLTVGSLEVFVASQAEDIQASQDLRYRVFVDEMGAKPTDECAALKRDIDKFDDVCDHLLVVDHQPDGSYKVVGTYRLLRRENMQKIGEFYSASEYDISAIDRYEGGILEVGRSCVDIQYRNRAAMQLLWRGIGAYVYKFDISLLFGCASFQGVNPQDHALALSYLYHYHLAPTDICPVALKERYIEMNMMHKDDIDPKQAFAQVPPLIKGYLRLSGYIGKGAVIDPEYNTTDVSIVVKTDRMAEKYGQRYGTISNNG